MDVQSATPEHAQQPIFPGTRRVPISKISDGLIEAGGCPDRSVYAALR